MATGPKIVHKQFNSPIGLYSQRNIQETLSKHLQNLDNGTVGIDFNNPSATKPANLANSAVLRMLEEENQSRRGKLDPSQVQVILETMVRVNRSFDDQWPPKTPKTFNKWNGEKIVRVSQGPKKVVWPPVPETNGYHSQQQQSPFYNSAQHSPQPQHQPEPQAQPQYQPQAQPQYQPQAQSQYQPQAQPQYQPQAHNQYQPQAQKQYQPPQNQQYQTQNQPQYYPEPQPSHCDGKKQEPTGLSKLIPVGPGVTSRPGPPSPSVAFRQGPPSPGVVPQPFRAQPNRWAPVPAPLSPQPQNTQQSYPQQFSPQPQEYSPQPYSEPYQPPQRQFEPPPSTITLRQQQPIHQKPPPVFASQPATASFQGGVNMRGDQKWPPQEVKEAVAAENDARRQLAKGPACRPRKVKKDYSSFFAQNALNQNYPGYRAPPGTQHYEELSGRSSY